jgi:prolyl-tRNA synthetase
MGFIAEHFADERGLVWPTNIAPFQVYLINIGTNEDIVNKTTKLYDELTEKGVEVLWDDRIDARPGEKFADADLLGIPHRIVVSPKLTEVGQFEHKARTLDIAENLTSETLYAKLEKEKNTKKTC